MSGGSTSRALSWRGSQQGSAAKASRKSRTYRSQGDQLYRAVCFGTLEKVTGKVTFRNGAEKYGHVYLVKSMDKFLYWTLIFDRKYVFRCAERSVALRMENVCNSAQMIKLKSINMTLCFPFWSSCAFASKLDKTPPSPHLRLLYRDVGIDKVPGGAAGSRLPAAPPSVINKARVKYCLFEIQFF